MDRCPQATRLSATARLRSVARTRRTRSTTWSRSSPRINSSAGITQLENQGSHTTSTAPVSFASSARGPNLGAGGKFDDQGLNFVAYAADGVDYVVYKKVGGDATAASTISGLTQTQLQDIWDGTDKCWSDVGATGANANDLIDPYSTVTSSAVTSTWDAFLSPDNSETYVDGQTTWPPATLPKCANGPRPSTPAPTSPTTPSRTRSSRTSWAASSTTGTRRTPSRSSPTAATAAEEQQAVQEERARSSRVACGRANGDHDPERHLPGA